MTVFQPIAADGAAPELRIWKETGFVPRTSARLVMINRTGEPQGKIGQQLMRLGFHVVYLPEDQSTLDELDANADCAGAVILDWRSGETKDGDFAELLACKAADVGLPVLTLTALARPEDMEIATDAGIANVLSMPCKLLELNNILNKLVKRTPGGVPDPAPHLSDAVDFLESCKFRFRTPEDVEKLAPFIANIFPYPERTAPGIAELMMNAIEHGNLEIGQDRKAEWVARGVYRNELLKRLHTPPYSSRWAELIINRREDGVMIVIMDEGCGFCWQDVIRNDAPASGAVTGQSGDGLARASRECFDDVRFNHIGNQVTAFVADETPL